MWCCFEVYFFPEPGARISRTRGTGPWTSDRKKLTANQISRIKGIPALTPGDIKAVWQKLRFLSNSELKHGDIIGELEKEVAYKSSERVVGY